MGDERAGRGRDLLSSVRETLALDWPQPDRSARPDASMSLLTSLFENTVEDGYANPRQASSAHAVQPGPIAKAARRTTFFALLVLCGLLATGFVRQAVTTQVGASADHEALVKEARQRSANVAAAERELVAERAAYAREQRVTLAKDAQGADELRSLQTLQNATGFNAVTGAGIVVSVDDASSSDVTGDDEAGRITDRDLQTLVNGLWAAGATAVSINGQRLTSLTAIREAGDAVLVDYRPLARPYVVTALGDRHTLAAEFGGGAAGRYFTTLQASFDVRFSVDTRDDLTLPPASTVTLRYARGRGNP